MTAPVLVEVVRDGAIESLHRGHVAVASASGALLSGLGDAEVDHYPRSAVKPFQGAAVVEELARRGRTLAGRSLAIACASHMGRVEQQVEAAYVLALSGLDEPALGCPPARPSDVEALCDDPTAHPLAHNCSGKHAAMLWAQTSMGEVPASYLDPEGPLQRRVAEVLEREGGAAPSGYGIDGCGAPAFRMPLGAVAVGFARLAAASEGPTAAVRRAMVADPHLVGGRGAADTELMRHDPRVVAKRGAEGVLGAGFAAPGGIVGVAVKVEDGSARAAGPAAAAVLARLGAEVPPVVASPEVLGGGVAHGSVTPVGQLAELL